MDQSNLGFEFEKVDSGEDSPKLAMFDFRAPNTRHHHPLVYGRFARCQGNGSQRRGLRVRPEGVGDKAHTSPEGFIRLLWRCGANILRTSKLSALVARVSPLPELLMKSEFSSDQS